MNLLAQLRAMCDVTPPGASVTLPRDWLLAALENDAPESPTSNDPPLALHKGPATVSTDGLLTAKQAAEKLQCSVRYMYAHAKDFPFTRRIGNMVRFSEAGLERFLKQRGVAA